MIKLVRDEIRSECDIPEDVFAQVAFNTNDRTTIHCDLLERLE